MYDIIIIRCNRHNGHGINMYGVIMSLVHRVPLSSDNNTFNHANYEAKYLHNADIDHNKFKYVFGHLGHLSLVVEYSPFKYVFG